ncbi:hypothetical protein YWY31_26700 [Paenibacillus illinoisensis]
MVFHVKRLHQNHLHVISVLVCQSQKNFFMLVVVVMVVTAAAGIAVFMCVIAH